MTKELEALNELRENLDFEGCLDFINEKRITDIKQALQRLEAIDNANPSEALYIQASFINAFKELLSKTDHNVIQINITRNMAQEIVNLYEQHKKLILTFYYKKII